MNKLALALFCVLYNASIGFAQCAPDLLAPTITCPPSQTVFLNASCTAIIPNYITLAAVNDNCTLANDIIISQSPAAGTAVSGVGTTQVTLTATDASGNFTICTFNVNRLDNILPTITCPENITVYVNAGMCTAAIASLVTPAAADNCSVSSVTNDHPSTTYTLGANSIVWTVTDGSGNITTCTQTVTVVDNIVPTITCPAAQTLALGAICTAGVPNYTALATVSDNCTAAAAIVVTQSPTVGASVSGVGVTVITLTATDASGNFATCTFNVSRVDNIAPVVTCPANDSLLLDVNCEALLFDYTTQYTDFYDNCDANVTFVQSPPANSIITSNTTVSISATDDSGNTTTCEFEVFVQPIAEVAIAPADFSTCNATNTISANEPPAGYTGGSFADATSANTTVTFNSTGIHILQWTITGTDNGCGIPISSDLLTVSYYFQEDCLPANAGYDIDACLGSDINLNATEIATPLIGQWTQIAGPSIGIFQNANDHNTMFIANQPGSYILQWTRSATSCCAEHSDEVVVNVFDADCTLAQVSDPDIELCNATSYVLDAVDPVFPATGFWTQISGPSIVAFANATDPNSAVTNLNFGTYILRWTVLAFGCCLASFDDVVITVYSVDQPPAFTAGPDQDICNTVAQIQLQGSTVPAPYMGQWTLLSGGGTIADPMDNSTTVTNLPIGQNIFRWTATVGAPCTNSVTDDVVITVYDNMAPAAYAGEDETICSPESSVELAANNPISPSLGSWEPLEGGGTFFDIISPNGGAINIPSGVNTYQWSIYNGPCGTTSDTVVITALEFCPPIAGDLDGDGVISMEEFNEILGAFGCTVNCDNYDLDGDGIVGMSDLLILIGNMGG
jgi:hypothetical protein